MKIKKIKPGLGQESVWDYPRPPAIEPFKGHLRIIFAGEVIVDTNRAFRVLETSHPPTYYLPIDDFKEGVLFPAQKTSFCEFKGMASYYDIKSDLQGVPQAAWGYPKADGRFEPIKGCVSVYAHVMEACYVNDEKVKAQEGDFYGGWITSDIVGPFKGAPRTWGW